jgi:hypothetical protein
MSEYYGDNSRWFIATVINSTPPIGYEGRVKIRIHGLHTASTVDIPEDHLPWAQCVLPTTEGGVSGIGKIPRVLPNALVFGMFMDGKSSQTPIVLGSLPRIELPTQIQKDTRQLTVEEEAVLASTLDIENGNTGTITDKIKKNRLEFSLQFFLNLGYTYNQSVGITENLSQMLGMMTGSEGIDESEEEPPEALFGIAGWTGIRLGNLKAFSPRYRTFTTQLEFIAFELRGTLRSVNLRLIETKTIGGEKGSLNIFAKYYLKLKPNELTGLLKRENLGDYE